MAPAIADGKAQRAFADCRRQKQTGKIGNKIPIKLPKLDNFYDIKIIKILESHKTVFSKAV